MNFRPSLCWAFLFFTVVCIGTACGKGRRGGGSPLLDGNVAPDALSDTGLPDDVPAFDCTWGTPQLPPDLNNTTGSDLWPTLSSNGLTIYMSRGNTERDLWRASRSSTSMSSAFGFHTQVTEVSSPVYAIELSSDSLELFYTSSLSAGTIRVASRAGSTGTFTSVDDLPFSGTSPTLSADGRLLYFLASGSLQRSTRGEDGVWSDPEDLMALGGEYAHIDLSPDGNYLLVSDYSSREIHVATRIGGTTTFGEPVLQTIPAFAEPMPSAAAGTFGGAEWGHDGRYMFFNIHTGNGNFDDIAMVSCL